MQPKTAGRMASQYPTRTGLWAIPFIVAALLVANGAAHTVGNLNAVTYTLNTNVDSQLCPTLCLFGVVPGVTSAAAATELLLRHPLLRGFDQISTDPFRIEGHNEWIMQVSFNVTADNLVDEITVARFLRYGHIDGERTMVLPEIGELGDVLPRFGHPDFVQLTRGGDPMLVFSSSGVIISLIRARGDPNGISLSQPVGRLTIFRRYKCPVNSFEYAFLPWLGVTQYRRYSFTESITRWVRPMTSMGATFAPCNP